MEEESNEIIDLNSNFFTVPENDHYVDLFFTDNKDDPLIQVNIQSCINEENIFSQQLFPKEVTHKHDLPAQIFQLNQQEKKLQTKKKMKNTYASKIAKLIHQDIESEDFDKQKQIKLDKQDEQQDHMNHFKQTSHHSGSIDHSITRKEQKLLKNRLSAQKSRKMKNQYMQKLAERVEQLQQQLQAQRKINQKNAQKLKKYSYHEAILNGYFISRDQIMQKLQQAIKNKASQQELSILLDSTKFRFGGSGKERMNIIRYYYEQIFDLMMPDMGKYIIYSAVKNIGVFNNNNQKATQFMKAVDIKDQKQQYIRSLKQLLIKARQSISQIAGDLVSVKQKFDKQVRKIDDIYDQMRCVLTVETEIRSILFLQKNKYKPEYSLAWKEWKNIFLQKFDSKESGLQPRKLIKTI